MGRIAFFLPRMAGGGTERVVISLAAGFQERGHTVDFVLVHADGPLMEAIPDGVRVVDLQGSGLLASLPGLTRYIRREKPQAFVSAPDIANPFVIWAKLLAMSRTKVLITSHTNLSASVRQASLWQYKILPLLLGVSWPFAKAIVAVSDGTADNLSKTARIPRKRIEVVYNPIPLAEIARLNVADVEHPWFAPSQPPVILAAGRLTEAKDYPSLLRAFALVAGRRPARLVILGDGELRAELSALAKDLGVADQVAMPGFEQNPYRYMARCAAFVLSSSWEGFGNVLVEALACGAQVVSTDCPDGPAEILRGGKYGRLAPIGDPESLAAAIEDALDHPLPKEMLSGRALQFVPGIAVDRYLEVLGLA
jgi:glycosyltransferase involved in cell wall biosynthesis